MGRWEDEAACLGSPTGWFVVDSGSYAPGLAVKLCSKCPVRSECLDNAIEDDRLYTIRGGLMPNTNDLPIEERPCRMGHVGEWYWIEGKSKQFWRCRECKKADDKKYYDKKRAGDAHRNGSEECRNGHVGEYRTRRDGRRECGGCVRNWDNIRNAKKRKARQDAKMNA